MLIHVIWSMIASDMVELLGSEDNNRVKELIAKMKEKSGCNWLELVLVYSGIEAIYGERNH